MRQAEERAVVVLAWAVGEAWGWRKGEMSMRGREGVGGEMDVVESVAAGTILRAEVCFSTWWKVAGLEREGRVGALQARDGTMQSPRMMGNSLQSRLRVKPMWERKSSLKAILLCL